MAMTGSPVCPVQARTKDFLERHDYTQESEHQSRNLNTAINTLDDCRCPQCIGLIKIIDLIKAFSNL